MRMDKLIEALESHHPDDRIKIGIFRPGDAILDDEGKTSQRITGILEGDIGEFLAMLKEYRDGPKDGMGHLIARVDVLTNDMTAVKTRLDSLERLAGWPAKRTAAAGDGESKLKKRQKP